MFTIDRIHRPSPEQLWRDYQSQNKPVIITGVASEWPVATWTPHSLRDRFPGLEVRYETWDGPEDLDDPVDWLRVKQKYHHTTLAEFVAMMDGVTAPTRRFYCAAFPIFEALPQLTKELGPIADYMGLPSWLPASARGRLQVKPYFWMGPAGALSPLHFDRTDNFFVGLHGRKKWVLVPPDDRDHVYFPWPDLPSNIVHFSPVDVEHPDLTRFPRYAQARAVEITVEQGEILYTPASWWHYVRSLTPSIALNFFWYRPVDNVLALRHYIYELARRQVVRGLGLGDRLSAAPSRY